METLKLDYDSKGFRRVVITFKIRYRLLTELFKFKTTAVNVYTTKHGYHVYVWLKNRFSNKDICFFQSIMCSCFKRESIYWYKLANEKIYRNKDWNILYVKKQYPKKAGRKRPSIERYSLNMSYELANVIDKINEDKKVKVGYVDFFEQRRQNILTAK